MNIFRHFFDRRKHQEERTTDRRRSSMKECDKRLSDSITALERTINEKQEAEGKVLTK